MVIVIVGTVLRDNIRTGGPKEAAKRVLRVFTTLRVVDLAVIRVQLVNILTKIIERVVRDVPQVNTRIKMEKQAVKTARLANIRMLITNLVAKAVL